MVCLALELVDSGWSLVSVWVWRLLDELLSINCSLESGIFWCSQVLDLRLLPLVFSLILTVASRLLHPYSTDDKTSRLMERRLSTVRDTQRGSQSYVEKRRGRQEIEVTRKRIKKEENQKGREQSSQQSIPYVLSRAWIPQRCSRSYAEKRRGRKDIEVTRRRGGGIKRRETDLTSNQFPKCSPQPGIPKEIHRVG